MPPLIKSGAILKVMMGTGQEQSGRKPRADGQRNREKLLEAAQSVFNAGGAGASLEAVARQAGLGIGTLYRHFPTREALFEAVYRREVQQLADLAGQLENGPEPILALRQWVRGLLDFVATKKGMMAALAIAVQSASEIGQCMAGQLVAAVERLMRPAIAAGALRDTIRAEEFLRGIIGLCYIQDTPDWREPALRLADVFLDGLIVPRQPG